MGIAQQEIHASMPELFAVDDLITCGDETFRVVAVLDDQIRLASLRDGSEAVTPYSAFGQASGVHDESAVVKRPPVEDCLILEYHRRADEARREAEVDAMWQSAMTCQL